MKEALADMQEEKLQKEKLAEIIKVLKASSYQTLLAVGGFLEEKSQQKERCFPRGVKYFGGPLTRAVPHRVVMDILMKCGGFSQQALRNINEPTVTLRQLWLYSLGQEESDEVKEPGMQIKVFTQECLDKYAALGRRLSKVKLQEGKDICWQGDDSVGYLFLAALGSCSCTPTHCVHRPSLMLLASVEVQDKNIMLKKCAVELPKAFQTSSENIHISANWSMSGAASIRCL